MKTIKIGRDTYDIQKGDYILYNSACYQFCAGDKRTLKYDGLSRITIILIPKSRIKEIPFDKLEKQESGNLIRWTF